MATARIRSELEWHGVTGGTVINMNKAADSRVAGLSVSGINGNTAGVIIDVDNYPAGGGGDGLATQNDTFERWTWAGGASGFASPIDPPATSRTWSSDDVQVSNPSNGQGGMWGYFFGGGGQTYNEEIRGGLIAGPRHRDHVGVRRTARDLRHRLRAEQDRGVDQRSLRRRRGWQHDVFRRDQRGRAVFHFRPEQHRLQLHHRCDANRRRSGTQRIPDAIESANRNQELVDMRRRNHHLRNQQRQRAEPAADFLDAEQLRRPEPVSQRRRQQRARHDGLHGVHRFAQRTASYESAT